MKNKRFLMAGLAILTAFAMLACGGGGSNSGSDPNKVDITFDPNYTGSLKLVINIVKDEALGSTRLTQVQQKQIRTGNWEFKGWVETVDGTTPVSITQNSSWDENKTYYGTWGETVQAGQPVEITFDLNGFPDPDGSIAAATVPKNAISGTAIGLSFLPVLTMPQGYQWLGWSKAADGTTYVSATDIFTSDTTLYARFVQPNLQGTAVINMASGALDADFLDLTKAAYSLSTTKHTDGSANYNIDGLYVANDKNNLYVALQLSDDFNLYTMDRIVVLVDNTDSEADTGKASTDDCGGSGSKAVTSGPNSPLNPKLAFFENVTGTVESRVYLKMNDWAQGPLGTKGASSNISVWNISGSASDQYKPADPSGTGTAGVIKFAIPLSEIANATGETELKVFVGLSMGWNTGPFPGGYAPTGAVTAVNRAWGDNGLDTSIDINMDNALTYMVKMSSDPGNITLIYDMNDLVIPVTYGPAEAFTPSAVPRVANKTIPSGTVIGTEAIPELTVLDVDFQGWSVSETGGTLLTGTESFSANTPLYAQWSDTPTITVSFNVNGLPEATAPSDVILNRGDAITTLTDPTGFDTGSYTFDGWARTATGTITDIIDGTDVFSGSATLYARWHSNTITITYDLNGLPVVAGAPNPATVTSGQAIGAEALPTVVSSDTERAFTGWSLSDVGTLVLASESFTANQTFYAQYTYSGAKANYARIGMMTGGLDADFNVSTKAAQNDDVNVNDGTNWTDYLSFDALYVANDAVNLYVALDLTSLGGLYEHDRIVLLIDNTAVNTGTAQTTTVQDAKIAQTEANSASVEARVYLKAMDWSAGPKGVTGATQNLKWGTKGEYEVKDFSPDPTGGKILKFAIPLTQIGSPVATTELNIFAAISAGWGGGSNVNLGSFAPDGAGTIDSVTAITIDMPSALSYTVK